MAFVNLIRRDTGDSSTVFDWWIAGVHVLGPSRREDQTRVRVQGL